MKRIQKWGWLVCWLAFVFAPVGDAFGMIWHWSNPMPFGNDVADMAWQNGTTVQVCDSGQLYTTDDLNLWLSRDTHTTNALQAVAYFGSRLVAVGANGTVVYSDDGADFTYTNLLTPDSDWLVGVAASPNLLVAVGDEAIIYTSPNGAAWTPNSAAPPGVGTHWLRGVTYGNGLFVTVGEGGYIATSLDGVAWTRRAPALLTNNLNWVSWVNTPASTNGLAAPGFIAVSDFGKVITSTNGTNWSVLNNFDNTNSFYGIAGNDDSRLFAGDGLLYLERDETNHTFFTDQLGVLPESAPPWTYYSAMLETNFYLVSGQSGLTIQSFEDTNNLYSWSSLDDSDRSWLWSVTVSSNLYVAVGDQASIVTSGDGVDWTIEAIPATNTVSTTNTAFFGVGGGPDMLIAVGTGGTTVLSTNKLVSVVTTNLDGTQATNQVSTMGVIWNPVPPPTTNDLHGVAFFNNQYYISGGNGTILSSPDGQAWTKQATPTTAYLSGLTVFSNSLVAVGNTGVILTSTSGSDWTARTSHTTNWIYHVRSLGGTLVAVGENGTILTSPDAVSWSTRTSGTTAWLNDVTLVTNAFYIVGNYGTILTSPDATNWTGVATITGNSLYGAATQGGQLITVGIGGAILRSQVVPILTPVNFLSFAQADGENLFLVGGETDQQFTLDSSPDLVHWTTGPLLDISDDSGTLLFYIPNTANSGTDTFYRTTLVVPQ